MSTATLVLRSPFLRHLVFGTSTGRKLVYRAAGRWAGANWIWLVGGGLTAAATGLLASPRVRARLLG